jgi:hypothetical protein
MQKPPRPIPTLVEEDYDDGDPFSCMAAAAAGIQQKQPNYLYLVDQACQERQPDKLDDLAAQDLSCVKAALYDIWDSGRNHPNLRDRGSWAAQQMARLGDSSLVEYDEAMP